MAFISNPFLSTLPYTPSSEDDTPEKPVPIADNGDSSDISSFHGEEKKWTWTSDFKGGEPVHLSVASKDGSKILEVSPQDKKVKLTHDGTVKEFSLYELEKQDLELYAAYNNAHLMAGVAFSQGKNPSPPAKEKPADDTKQEPPNGTVNWGGKEWSWKASRETHQNSAGQAVPNDLMITNDSSSIQFKNGIATVKNVNGKSYQIDLKKEQSATPEDIKDFKSLNPLFKKVREDLQTQLKATPPDGKPEPTDVKVDAGGKGITVDGVHVHFRYDPKTGKPVEYATNPGERVVRHDGDDCDLLGKKGEHFLAGARDFAAHEKDAVIRRNVEDIIESVQHFRDISGVPRHGDHRGQMPAQPPNGPIAALPGYPLHGGRLPLRAMYGTPLPIAVAETAVGGILRIFGGLQRGGPSPFDG